MNTYFCTFFFLDDFKRASFFFSSAAEQGLRACFCDADIDGPFPVDWTGFNQYLILLCEYKEGKKKSQLGCL